MSAIAVPAPSTPKSFCWYHHIYGLKAITVNSHAVTRNLRRKTHLPTSSGDELGRFNLPNLPAPHFRLEFLPSTTEPPVFRRPRRFGADKSAITKT
nr:unnamed protein product [Spirometra erinaceieuropaei]